MMATLEPTEAVLRDPEDAATATVQAIEDRITLARLADKEEA